MKALSLFTPLAAVLLHAPRATRGQASLPLGATASVALLTAICT